MRPGGVAVGVAVALSSAGRLASSGPYSRTNSPRNLFPSPYEGSSSRYVSARRLEWMSEGSERDWAVLRDIERLRLVSGEQLERLHFTELSELSRAVVRRRVLGRLVRWRVLATLERRIGGERAGSAGLVYALDTAGKRLLARDDRARRPSMAGMRFVRHVLAVSEVYVNLAERARSGDLQLEVFQAEPACWWPDGKGGMVKPDAFALVAAPTHLDHWWIEVDLATEHLPTLRRKLMNYRDFWRGGQLGPDEVMPRILVIVRDTKRYSELVRLIRQLPSDVENLFIVAIDKDATDVIVGCLNKPN